MIETIQIVLAAIAGILTLGIYIYRLRRTPPPQLSYEQLSKPNSAQWRWRKPAAELGLQLQDDEQSSTLLLPAQMMPFETFCIILGYFGFFLALLYFATRIYLQAALPEFLVGFGLAGIAFGMLHIGMRVSTLTLHQDQLVLCCSFGFFFEHRFIYKRSKTLRFSTESNFIHNLNHEEHTPVFIVFIKKSRFSNRERFDLSVNRSQGTWLLAGLNQWLECAQSPQQV